MTRNTQVITISSPEQNPQGIAKAAKFLLEGKLVVFPTETVYGIGANALDSEAAAAIFTAKGRPQDNPLIAHIADMDTLEQIVQDIPNAAKLAAEAFWPGPLTMVLPKKDLVPVVTSGGLDTIAVRMPSHPVAREIIRQAGVPIAAPSANLSGKPSPTTAAHCIADLDRRVDLIVDSGPSIVGLESTVISLVGELPKLLRPGAVTLSQLEQVLGKVEVDPAVMHHLEDNVPVASPGMKYKHYAPKAQLELVTGTLNQFRTYLETQQGEGVYALVFDEDLEEDFPVTVICYGPEKDSEIQGQNLFRVLRELDDLNAVKVYARTPNKNGVGMAVYNRLARAAGFSERTL